MEELLEEYRGRIKTLLLMLDETDPNNSNKIIRLHTKLGCYRTFINEVERELKKEKKDGLRS